ncbi:MAG: hypothetical protein CH6_3219 [Candidatus Kapaibacterium sp.]|nr:MAG: hypothetical protein CH6_3219 [Candidatus Kapabacteria bacterium]
MISFTSVTFAKVAKGRSNAIATNVATINVVLFIFPWDL